MQKCEHKSQRGEQGFMMAALLFAVALMLLVLAIAAPRMAMQLKRDRELETVHRGKQYARAIRLYYRKMGAYPTSIEQLAKQTNNIRFLRKQYLDPMTGKDDWKPILLGHNKTHVLGFFGKPLGGGGSNLGSAAGMVSNTGGMTGGMGAGIGSSLGGGSGFGGGIGSGAGVGGFGTGGTGIGIGQTTGGATGASGASGASGATGTSGSTFGSVGGGPIMGVSSASPVASIIELSKQTHYNEWEFFYDPIQDQQMVGNLLGGGPVAAGVGGLGAGAAGATGTTGTSGIGGSMPGFGTTGSTTPVTTPQPAPQTPPQ